MSLFPYPTQASESRVLRTSRYQSADLINASGLTPIGITLGRPRFTLAFTLAGELRRLAPSRAIFRLEPWDLFREAYLEQLDRLGVAGIEEGLSRFAGPGLVLCCFEDLSKDPHCHRRLFAQWWQDQTGEEVPEL